MFIQPFKYIPYHCVDSIIVIIMLLCCSNKIIKSLCVISIQTNVILTVTVIHSRTDYLCNNSILRRVLIMLMKYGSQTLV